MCVQRDGHLLDLSEEELFDGIDKAIKNVSCKADMLFYSEINKKEESQFLNDCLVLSMMYMAYYKESADIILKNLENKQDTKNRKNTGSYFTPTYIAEYMCKETIDKLIRNVTARAFHPNGEKENIYHYLLGKEEIYNLKICDPALGGGIFLICAHDYLVSILNELGDPPEVSARRAVKCLYGVDINPNAIEISKLLLNLNVMKWEIKPKIKEFVSFAG